MRTRMTGKVGFHEDIAGLTPKAQRDCMNNAGFASFDLHDFEAVKARGPRILERIKGTTGEPLMPPEGWPQANIDTFEDWVEEGMPKYRADKYSAFFAELDYRTEYFDVSGLPASDNLALDFRQYFNRAPLLRWWEYAAVPLDDTAEKDLLWDEVAFEIDTVGAGDAILAVEDVLRELAKKYFFQDDGTLDQAAMIEAFSAFGRDRLPADTDRLNRIRQLGVSGDPRLTYAEFHRMDGDSMWFNWAGHLEMAAHLKGSADPDRQITHTMMAAIAAGSAMDFVFRMRGRTKSRYQGQGEAAILRQARRSLQSLDVARRELHELVKIFVDGDSMTPAMIAAARDSGDRVGA